MAQADEQRLLGGWGKCGVMDEGRRAGGFGRGEGALIGNTGVRGRGVRGEEGCLTHWEGMCR